MSVATDRRHMSTPSSLVDWCVARYGVSLDVCASPWNAKLPRYYSLEHGQDGLVLPWDVAVWCNPPWSSVEPWLVRGADQILSGVCPLVVYCLPHRPNVGWWRRYIDRADPRLSVVRHEIEGRIIYGAQEKTSSGGFEPSILIVMERMLRAVDFNGR